MRRSVDYWKRKRVWAGPSPDAALGPQGDSVGRRKLASDGRNWDHLVAQLRPRVTRFYAGSARNEAAAKAAVVSLGVTLSDGWMFSVNNAGYGQFAPFEAYECGRLQAVVEHMFLRGGVVYTTRAAVPWMRSRRRSHLSVVFG